MNKGKAKEIRAKLNALDPASDDFDAEIRGLYEQVMGASAGTSIPSERVYRSVEEALEEVLGQDKDGGLPPEKPKRKPREAIEVPKVRTFKVERKLPVTLKQEEITVRVAEIAKAIEDRSGLEAQTLVLKNQIKSLAQRIGVLDDEIDRIGGVLKTGREERSVEVAVTLDLKNNRYEEVRTDTGEVTVDRALQGSERQGTLFDPNAPQEKNDADTDGEATEGEVTE